MHPNRRHETDTERPHAAEDLAHPAQRGVGKVLRAHELIVEQRQKTLHERGGRAIPLSVGEVNQPTDVDHERVGVGQRVLHQILEGEGIDPVLVSGVAAAAILADSADEIHEVGGADVARLRGRGRARQVPVRGIGCDVDPGRIDLCRHVEPLGLVRPSIRSGMGVFVVAPGPERRAGVGAGMLTEIVGVAELVRGHTVEAVLRKHGPRGEPPQRVPDRSRADELVAERVLGEPLVAHRENHAVDPGLGRHGVVMQQRVERLEAENAVRAVIESGLVVGRRAVAG